MQFDERYTITLTDSTHKHTPKERVLYRSSDRDAIDAAERELRRHINTSGARPIYDGWRLTIKVPPQWTVRTIAETRPGYDSRTPKTVPSGGRDGFPF